METTKASEKYAGGNWDKTGLIQFGALKDLGLKPGHKFLDIGCGAGRVGHRVIGFLNNHNYFGFDPNGKAVDMFMQAIADNKAGLEGKGFDISTVAEEYYENCGKFGYRLAVAPVPGRDRRLRALRRVSQGTSPCAPIARYDGGEARSR